MFLTKQSLSIRAYVVFLLISVVSSSHIYLNCLYIWHIFSFFTMDSIPSKFFQYLKERNASPLRTLYLLGRNSHSADRDMILYSLSIVCFLASPDKCWFTARFVRSLGFSIKNYFFKYEYITTQELEMFRCRQ